MPLTAAPYARHFTFSLPIGPFVWFSLGEYDVERLSGYFPFHRMFSVVVFLPHTAIGGFRCLLEAKVRIAYPPSQGTPYSQSIKDNLYHRVPIRHTNNKK